MSNKRIFLDNDGVICLSNNWGGRTRKFNKYRKLHPEADALSWSTVDVFHLFDDFYKKAVKILNQILLETGAQIVVSSDWKKHATLEELGDYYNSQGIIRRPIGLTKSWVGCDKPEGFAWKLSLKYEQERSFEINQYVKDNPEITHWVAVDDLDMTLRETWGIKNFVLTPKMSEGIKQSGIKEKIISFLTDNI
jgi:hypothetical protein